MVADLMTIDEVIDRLGMSRSKVQEMQRNNELPFRRIELGGRILFSRRAYDAWLAQYDFIPKEEVSGQTGTDV